MKNILLFLLLLPASFVLAQNSTRLRSLTELKSELDNLEKNEIKVQSISIADSGDWLLLFGDFGYSYNMIPNKLASLIKSQNSKQTILKSAQLFNEQEWFLASENTTNIAVKNVELYKSFKLLKSKNKNIRKVIVNSDGQWLILYNGNGLIFSKIPVNMQQQLKRIKSIKSTIDNIYVDGNSWLIQYGKTNISFKNIPNSLAPAFKQLVEKKYTVNHIEINKGNWVIVYNNYRYMCNF